MTATKIATALFISLLLGACGRATPQVTKYAFDLMSPSSIELFDSEGKPVSAQSDHAFENACKISVRGADLGFTPAYQANSLAKKLGSHDTFGIVRLPIDGTYYPIFWYATANLPSGDFLITGGCKASQNGLPMSDVGTHALNRTWLVDGKTFEIKDGPRMQTARMAHAATRLSDGRILVTGGHTGDYRKKLASCEVFNPTSNSFVDLGQLSRARSEHSATQLGDGAVLVVGGLTDGGLSDAGFSATSLAELFDLGTGRSTVIGQLHGARTEPQVLPYGTDQAIVFGGHSDDDVPFWESDRQDEVKGVELLVRSSLKDHR